MVVSLYAMNKGFDFIVEKSGTTVWYINAKFRLRVEIKRKKKNVLSDMFKVQEWFAMRKEIANKCTKTLSPKMEQDMAL
uniref:Uncharacterized protein n=1 Tax=Cannabis sativa TaxID=3483 RepID=A0A803NTM0_CANSA